MDIVTLERTSRRAAGGSGHGLEAWAGSFGSWKTDPDPASVRDNSALGHLAEPEQVQWQEIWTTVSMAVATSQIDR